MKTFFIIEADTKMHSLFAYAVERENDGVGDFYIYKRRMACDATWKAQLEAEGII